MDLILQYQTNSRKIRDLSINKRKLEEAHKKADHELTWSYRDKINALEKERDDKATTLNQEYGAQTEAIETETAQQYEIIKEVERILMFLALKPREIVWDDTLITNKGRGWGPEPLLESLGEIYSDEWLKIRVMLLENRKPVNKYSVCIYGRCMFIGRNDRETFLKYPHSYGVPGNHTGMQIAEVLKEFPTVASAKAWYEKQKHLFLKPFIEEYLKVKEEYKRIHATYKVGDFAPLLVVRCKACGFFMTRQGLDYYSFTDGKCPHCDIDQKEANLIAGASKKELPLYVSREWKSEEAKIFYDRRMHEAMTGE